MTDEHHTAEQVDQAFAYAPTILRKLKEAGVDAPYFELHSDASGRLELGEKVTHKQYDLAVSLIHSRREAIAAGIAIDFCCGLVVAAENSL